MSEKTRRKFTADQKVSIVKRHLIDQVPISDLCEEYQILATQFYQWQRQLFENGAAAFERQAKSNGPSAEQRKIDALEAKIVNKNEVIAELMEENVKAKKNLGNSEGTVGSP